jgi:(E)-4-hydroxy-3-methylbut-2-enyl-diphosphate synthase
VAELAAAGCEIVRVAVPGKNALRALPAVIEASPLPVVADVHFRLDLALGAVRAGVAKVRINPGNLGADEFLQVIDAAGEAGVPVRIGVNSGSVPGDLVDAFGGPTPEAIVAAATRYVACAEKRGFGALVLSLKSSDTLSTVQAYRRARACFSYPLHLGVTEAGDALYGQVKSAAALGGLLLDGIGDTVRISLVGDPVKEVEAAYTLLKATGRRVLTPEIIACPTCGRKGIDVERLVGEVTAALKDVRCPLKIAICGCIVNGPGEAREADLGIAGGGGTGILFRHGEILKRVPEENLVVTLLEEVRRLAAAHGAERS